MGLPEVNYLDSSRVAKGKTSRLDRNKLHRNKSIDISEIFQRKKRGLLHFSSTRNICLFLSLSMSIGKWIFREKKHVTHNNNNKAHIDVVFCFFILHFLKKLLHQLLDPYSRRA